MFAKRLAVSGVLYGLLSLCVMNGGCSGDDLGRGLQAPGQRADVGDDGRGLADAGQQAGSELAIRAVRITPEQVFNDSDVRCEAEVSAPEGGVPTLTYRWKLAATDAELGAGPTLSLAGRGVTPGGDLTCEAEATLGTSSARDAASIAVTNRAPVLTRVALSTASARVGDTLTCTAQASDPDGDALDLAYTWSTGATGPTYVLAASDRPGSQLRCTVAVTDPYGGAVVAESDTAATVLNSPPVVTGVSVTPEQGRVGDVLTCDATASDADGDELVLTYAWSREGEILAQGPWYTIAAGHSPGASIACTATAVDPQGATASGVALGRIDNSPPEIRSVTIAPPVARVGETVRCVVDAVDADGEEPLVSVAWSTGAEGATLVLTGQNAAPGDVVTCTATARDAQGATASRTSDVGMLVANAAPVLSDVAILPSSPRTTDTLLAEFASSDPDGGTPEIAYRWTVTRAGTEVVVGTAATLPPTSFLRGDVVSLVVEASDGMDVTAVEARAVTVENSPPTPPEILLSPVNPKAGEELSCTVALESTDADGDAVQYAFRWFKEGVFQFEESGADVASVVDAANVDDLARWTCEVVASDGLGGESLAVAREVLVIPFVWIPAGTYVQGPPQNSTTTRAVTISRAFYMQSVEVTQGQWRELMGNNPSRFSSCGDDCPVERVNWYEALAYLNAASQRDGYDSCYTLTGCTGELGSGCGTSSGGTACPDNFACEEVTFHGLSCNGYRLPTEAEWEYAARGGTTTQTYNGDLADVLVDCADSLPVLGSIAWYVCNGLARTQAVGLNSPNAYGLHDMLGNVLEWNWDWNAAYTSSSVTDPLGPGTGLSRMYRGGSFGDTADLLTASHRRSNVAGFRGDRVGLRPVRTHIVAPEFVQIPAGTYTQGPDPVGGATREVALSRAFWLQNTEVTHGQWRAAMGNNPSYFQGCGDDCPVEQVSWWDALAYLNALSRREALPECYDLAGCTGTPGAGDYTCTGWQGSRFEGLSCAGYRLPTEAEWEYAARAGTSTRTYNGDLASTDCPRSLAVLDSIAWYSCNSGESPRAVGHKRPNAFGLYDVLGNAWEWTADWYGPYPAGAATDPEGPDAGLYRVIRGGSWFNFAGRADAASRYEDFPPSGRFRTVGFRPARTHFVEPAFAIIPSGGYTHGLHPDNGDLRHVAISRAY